MLAAVENLGDPAVLAHDALGLAVHQRGVGEQLLRILDAVVLSVSQERSLERHARSGSVLEDLLNLGVGQNLTVDRLV